MQTKISAIYSKQRGAALIVSLIILLVMTLIGVTSMQTTIMQEKMAGNSRDLSMAFQAAEGAARTGETWLSGLTAVPDPTICTLIAGQCALWSAFNLGPGIIPGDPSTALMQAAGASGYTDSGLWASGRSATLPLPATMTQPIFFVEHIDIFRDSQNLGQQQDLNSSSFRNVYAVTTRGTGGTTTANAFVQTNFVRRF